MYLDYAATMFVLLDLDLVELMDIAPYPAVSYMLLHIKPSSKDILSQMQNPYLLYSRYTLRSLIETCFISQSESRRISHCASFLEDALFNLSKPHSASPLPPKFNQRLCAIVYELGMYYFICNQPAAAIIKFSMLRRMLTVMQISATEDIPFVDLERVRKAELMCKQAVEAAGPSEQARAHDCLAQLIRFKRHHIDHAMIVKESVQRSLPIGLKQLLARAALKENQIEFAMIQFLCNAMSALIDPDQDPKPLLLPEFMDLFMAARFGGDLYGEMIAIPVIIERLPEFSNLRLDIDAWRNRGWFGSKCDTANLETSSVKVVFSTRFDYAALGTSLATGDFDGDGLADIVIGSPGFQFQSGSAFIVLGSSPLLKQATTDGRTSELMIEDTADFRIGIEARDPDAVGARFGSAMAVIDLNGDGIDDLAVSAPLYGSHTPFTFDNSSTYSQHRGYDGCIFVLFGRRREGLRRDGKWDVIIRGRMDRSTTSSTTATQMRSSQEPAAEDRFLLLGQTLVAMDVDGDGYNDLVVGSPQASILRGTHQVGLFLEFYACMRVMYELD
eukprot:jgi/Hompol1/1834/HPOL_000624-RA